MLDGAFVAGRPVPSDCLGRLHETADWRQARDELPALMQRDGYVLLRAALDVALVRDARRDVLERLAAVGEIAEPIDAAVATGTSRRAGIGRAVSGAARTPDRAV